MRRPVLAALLLLAIPGWAFAQSGDPARDRFERGLTPGTVFATAQDVMTLMRAICLSTAPDFQDAETAMGAHGFRFVSSSGTRYHERLNVSMKVVASEGAPVCSLVAFSNDPALEMMLAAAALSAEAEIGSVEANAFQPGGYRFAMVVK
ncbi:MAG: hypothetical protein AAGE13_02750 [Pseudomonadota bacterium]